jgi:hypothetical protein
MGTGAVTHNAKMVLCRLFVASAIAAAGLAGCVDEPTTMPGSLDRVRLVNAPLSLGDTPVVAESFAPSKAGTLTYVAAVASPTVSDVQVQATNFAIDGSHAYVVYNNAGSQPIAGGLDVVDLSHDGQPALVASLVDTDAEFADVAASGGYVYAVGADADGAILRVWNVQSPTNPSVVTTFALDGQYGTSLLVEGTTIYATVGANGGLATIDVSDPAHPTLVRATEAANALAVARKGVNNLVLFGDQSLQLEGEHDGSVWALPTLAAAPVAAPGRMIIDDDRAIINAGTTGLTVVHLTGDGEAATITGNIALDGTGNGLGMSGNELFLAQGEAGVEVYDLDGENLPKYRGKISFPNESASANQVRTGGKNQVLVGSGRGGFRILTYTP